jgi:hypothetical protein
MKKQRNNNEGNNMWKIVTSAEFEDLREYLREEAEMWRGKADRIELRDLKNQLKLVQEELSAMKIIYDAQNQDSKEVINRLCLLAKHMHMEFEIKDATPSKTTLVEIGF